jgi:hypothetical protein
MQICLVMMGYLFQILKKGKEVNGEYFQGLFDDYEIDQVTLL